MVDGLCKAGAARLNEIAEYAFNGLQVSAVKAISRLRLAVGDSHLPSSVDSNRTLAARYWYGLGNVTERMRRGMK